MSVRTAVAAALGAVSVLAAAGCSVPLVSPGEDRTETREVAGLADADGVRLGGVGTVTVRQGTTPSLTVTAGERVIDRLTTRVDDGVLVVDLRGVSGNVGTPEIDVVLAEVRTVELDGSGRIDVAPVTADLTVGLDGSGEVALADVDAGELTVTIDGSGVVRAAGRVDEQTVGLDGSGSYAGDDLVSQDAAVSIGGSGDIRVHAEGRLDVRVSGSGTVRHSGGADVTSEVDGIGDVIRTD